MAMHVSNPRAWSRIAHPHLRAAVLATLVGVSAPGPVAAQDSVPTTTQTAQDGVTQFPAAQPQPPVTADTPEVPPAPVVGNASARGHDMSPAGMFLSADLVVQGVMVVLALASMATWVVLLVKGFGLFVAKRRMRAAIADIRGAGSLSDASSKVRAGVAVRLLLEAEEELGTSQGLPADGIKERAAIGLQRIEAATAKRMAVGTGILATTGSIGPFVGLFGTVWGIMNSFIGIAHTNTTNLAVVAPGIAEALLATGIGLVAAIPAVVIYNVLTRSIGGYRMLVGDAVALVMRHLSRDLDRRAAFQGSKVGLRMAAE